MKALFAFIVVAAGCTSRPAAPDDAGFADLAGSPDLASPAPKTNVDILFVLDDTPSSVVVNALVDRFPVLAQQLDGLAAAGSPASFHIGVITNDLGAAQETYASNCQPGGDGGRLVKLGKAHAPQCQQPTGGVNFIDYDLIQQTNNLPTGQDLSATLTCMASVGDVGCGFDHTLESAYRALSGTVPENAGFLRPDSLLVVFFVIDEDDCSAPPDTDLFSLSTPDDGLYGKIRCTHWGVACNGQLAPDGDSGGPLMGCVGAPNPMTVTSDSGNNIGPPPPGQGKLMDVQRYLDFFGKPGGVRADPNDVILAAVDPPEMPFQISVSNGAGQPCAPVDGTHCGVVVDTSCSLSSSFFGDPPVRINQLVNGVKNSLWQSMCTADYSPIFVQLGQMIGNRLGQR